MNPELPTLVCTVGLPRSGKTTWAKSWSAQNNAPIVNPDSIRLALHGQRFVSEAEPFVWAIAKAMVRSLFLAGHRLVIVDATNNTRKRRDEWQSKHWNTLFHDLGTSAEECFQRARDMKDDYIIPVIERMAAEKDEFGEDEAQGIPLGSTGAFPEGKCGDDDEGELRIALAADPKAGIVRVEFGKPVAWLGLPPRHASAFGQSLLQKVRALEG